MKRGLTGEYVVKKTGDEIVRAFVPKPLPPNPPLVIGPTLRDTMDEALISLGRLDSVTTLLPETDLFLYMYVRREAVISSQIEGTQSTLSDLLLFELEEMPGGPLDEVKEISHYVVAMEHGWKRLREDFPLSNRLIREIHKILLSDGRGKDQEPGEFRRTQNWIQGTRPGNALFVPPPPDQVPETMSALEKFLHNVPERTSSLIKIALAHVQFETIHPFLDGNGRVGRLLITLILCHEKILRQPLLYLSLYLKQHRKHYFDLLMRVRLEGDWEAWLLFFAEGIREMAEGAVTTARKLTDIAAEDRKRIATQGRKAGSALHVQQTMQMRPFANIPFLMKQTGLTAPTIAAALNTLQALGIVKETSGRKRNRLFSYQRYLNILIEGTEN